MLPSNIPFKSASIIGAGNVGSHFAKVFQEIGVRIDTIYSKHISNADLLVKETGGTAIDDFTALCQTSDLFVICVPDDHIKAVADEVALILPPHATIVHTSGSRPLTDLLAFERRGVFYPLQTFSKHDIVHFEDIPLLIDASVEPLKDQLIDLGKLISARVMPCDDRQRSELHVAAVLACNFVNHLIYKSEAHLERSDLDVSLLYPLIRKTVEKALSQSSFDAQTGPARRGDKQTIQRHLDQLAYDKKLKKIYKCMTNSILKTYALESK